MRKLMSKAGAKLYAIARDVNPVNDGGLIIMNASKQYNLKGVLDKKRRRYNGMRNKVCYCGSGVKFKRCCWWRYPDKDPTPFFRKE